MLQILNISFSITIYRRISTQYELHEKVCWINVVDV
jgi:hypothetical protein